MSDAQNIDVHLEWGTPQNEQQPKTNSLRQNVVSMRTINFPAIICWLLGCATCKTLGQAEFVSQKLFRKCWNKSNSIT